MEILDPLFEKYKTDYAKDLSSYDKQLKMEFLSRKIPYSYTSSNPAKYTYASYLKSLLAENAKNPCLNHYIFVKKYLSSDQDAQQLQQYEAEVSNLLASGYDPKYASCAAQMAVSIAHKYSTKAIQNIFYNTKEFEKSVEWATKADQIVSQSANGVLNSLDKALEKEKEAGSFKYKIKAARTQSLNRATDEINTRIDRFNSLNESYKESVKLRGFRDKQILEKMKNVQEEIIQICEKILSDYSDLAAYNPKGREIFESRIKRSRESILQVEAAMKT